MSGAALADAIDALLPQTQCSQCGYSGCMPYARAVAAGKADINRCPPGGAASVRNLAALLGREPKPLDPCVGAARARTLALIDEARCIGCTLCIQACPVDAIVGAARLMHSVIAELCTGCELCLPPCPVDCIDLVPLPAGQAAWTQAMADAARARHAFRALRLAREQTERRAHLARRAAEKPGLDLPDAKKAAIRAALERARARIAPAGAAPEHANNLSPRTLAGKAALGARPEARKKQ